MTRERRPRLEPPDPWIRWEDVVALLVVLGLLLLAVWWWGR